MVFVLIVGFWFLQHVGGRTRSCSATGRLFLARFSRFIYQDREPAQNIPQPGHLFIRGISVDVPTWAWAVWGYRRHFLSIAGGPEISQACTFVPSIPSLARI